MPIDLSDEAFRIAEYALKLARDVNASVIILHVVRRPQLLGASASRKYYEEARRYTNAWFEKIEKIGKGVNIRSKITIDSKSIVGSIVESAAKAKVDMIVMGADKNSRSIAHGVVTHAKCPVLVVKDKL